MGEGEDEVDAELDAKAEPGKLSARTLSLLMSRAMENVVAHTPSRPLGPFDGRAALAPNSHGIALQSQHMGRYYYAIPNPPSLRGRTAVTSSMFFRRPVSYHPVWHRGT